ncbi:LPXTG cell wall anchor domain-containing protein [Bifidobacterium callimiconis]|uniref:LPXTG cell wall anchor domain-containing protein n=1 Tax=Bifidobacterium callimiconis TaxID=2306973 RepID=UPI001BDC567D|nr:LPXTG cell wall anchor domain-containing protein [Bifidobacterium callimiconis]MBT1177166.1 LPXTG cell wall anchor domain-containing protein [Bifidobacterium callimiconis]
MTSIKTRVAAAFAAVVAVFAAFVLAPAASAADYGTVVPSVSGNTATVTVTVTDDLYNQGYTQVYVTADDTLVENIVQVANKTWGPFTLSTTSPHTATLKYIFKSGVTSATFSAYAENPSTGATQSIGSATVKAPATGEGSSSTSSSTTAGTTSSDSNKLAKTGTVLLPYLTAVAVLAVAGGAVFAVRRSMNR